MSDIYVSMRYDKGCMYVYVDYFNLSVSKFSNLILCTYEMFYGHLNECKQNENCT